MFAKRFIDICRARDKSDVVNDKVVLAHVTYSVSHDCKNGRSPRYTCLKCGKCGRRFENGIMK